MSYRAWGGGKVRREAGVKTASTVYTGATKTISRSINPLFLSILELGPSDRFEVPVYRRTGFAKEQ